MWVRTSPKGPGKVSQSEPEATNRPAGDGLPAANNATGPARRLSKNTRDRVTQKVQQLVRQFETELTEFKGAYYGRIIGGVVKVSHPGALRIDVEFLEDGDPTEGLGIKVSTNLERRDKFWDTIRDPLVHLERFQGVDNPFDPSEFPLLYGWSEPKRLEWKISFKLSRGSDSITFDDGVYFGSLTTFESWTKRTPFSGYRKQYAKRPLNDDEVRLLLGVEQSAHLSPQGQKVLVKCQETFEEVFPAKGGSIFYRGPNEKDAFSIEVGAPTVIELSGGAAQTWLEELEVPTTDRLNGTSYRAVFYIGMRGRYRSCPFSATVLDGTNQNTTATRGRSDQSRWSKWSEPKLVTELWEYEVTNGNGWLWWIDPPGKKLAGRVTKVIIDNYKYERPRVNLPPSPDPYTIGPASIEHYELRLHLDAILQATHYQPQKLPDVTTIPTPPS